MKTKDFSKKVLVALTMMLTLAMNAEAQKSTQDQRVMEFQTVMAITGERLRVGEMECIDESQHMGEGRPIRVIRLELKKQ
ncbi:MAG: hypothetical protein K6A32_06670 [Bacteroidales bacterium]|nr:hypothetical protein [Bacteroidales bacterium]